MYSFMFESYAFIIILLPMHFKSFWENVQHQN